jgi:hypothetical protein
MPVYFTWGQFSFSVETPPVLALTYWFAVPTAPAWLQRAGLGADVMGTGATQRGSEDGGRLMLTTLCVTRRVSRHFTSRRDWNRAPWSGSSRGEDAGTLLEGSHA